MEFVGWLSLLGWILGEIVICLWALVVFRSAEDKKLGLRVIGQLPLAICIGVILGFFMWSIQNNTNDESISNWQALDANTQLTLCVLTCAPICCLLLIRLIRVITCLRTYLLRQLQSSRKSNTSQRSGKPRHMPNSPKFNALFDLMNDPALNNSDNVEKWAKLARERRIISKSPIELPKVSLKPTSIPEPLQKSSNAPARDVTVVKNLSSDAKKLLRGEVIRQLKALNIKDNRQPRQVIREPIPPSYGSQNNCDTLSQPMTPKQRLKAELEHELARLNDR